MTPPGDSSKRFSVGKRSICIYRRSKNLVSRAGRTSGSARSLASGKQVSAHGRAETRDRERGRRTGGRMLSGMCLACLKRNVHRKGGKAPTARRWVGSREREQEQEHERQRDAEVEGRLHGEVRRDAPRTVQRR